MNRVGATLLLFFAFQEIVLAKLFLVETADKKSDYGIESDSEEKQKTNDSSEDLEKLNSETEKQIKKSTRWPPAPAPSSWPTPAPAPTSWPSPAPAPVWTPKPTPGHAHFGPPKPLKRIKEPSSWPSPAPATLWTPNPKLNKAPAPAPEAGAEAKPTPGHAHFGPKPGIGHAPATAPEAGAEAKPTSACAPASATPGSVNRKGAPQNRMAKSASVAVAEGQDGDGLIQGGMADDLLQLISNQVQLKKPEIVVCSEDVVGQPPSGSSPDGSTSTKTGDTAATSEGAGAGGCEGAAEEALKLTNEYRAKHGVGPLTLDPQISAEAQKWANEMESKGMSLFDSANPHSELSTNKYANSENIGVSSNVAQTVKMFYDEINAYDFNNPGQGFGGVTGHFENMVWKNQKTMGVGCAKAKEDNLHNYVMQYKREGNGQGEKKENVLPPK